MSNESFVETVQRRTAAIEPALVELAMASTLRGLGGQAPDDVEELTGVLDPRSVAWLRSGRHETPVDVAAIHDELVAGGLRIGIAVELVETVAAELARRVDGATRARLRRHVAPDWAALLADAPAPSHATPRAGRHGQAHSIASNPEPHAETKLSSAVGMTAERRGDTLATGRPGSARPLATGGEDDAP